MENSKIFTFKITSAPLQYGFTNVRKSLQDYFPKGKETVKVGAVFDDSNEEVELSYQN